MKKPWEAPSVGPRPPWGSAARIGSLLLTLLAGSCTSSPRSPEAATFRTFVAKAAHLAQTASLADTDAVVRAFRLVRVPDAPLFEAADGVPDGTVIQAIRYDPGASIGQPSEALLRLEISPAVCLTIEDAEPALREGSWERSQVVIVVPHATPFKFTGVSFAAPGRSMFFTLDRLDPAGCVRIVTARQQR